MDTSAQISSVWVPTEAETSSPVNLFADWDGQYDLAGIRVESEPGVVFEAAFFSCLDARVAAVSNRSAGGTRSYLFQAPQTVKGRCEIVFEASTTVSSTMSQLEFDPVLKVADGDSVSSDILSVREVLRTRAVRPTAHNRVGIFDERFDRPMPASKSGLLSSERAYTIELWARTTAVDKIILSSWSGSEDVAYPFELVVEPAGRLVFYTGEPGRHESMSSGRPIADGRWHHFAVANNPRSRKMMLVVDGVATDSLRWNGTRARRTGFLTVGGRAATAQSLTGLYRGDMDEIRLWQRYRSPDEIKTSMYRSKIESDDVLVLFDFEADSDVSGVVSTTSTLTFVSPVEDLRARVDERDVTLSWTGTTEGVHEFVVEQSPDGQTFSAAGSIPITPGGVAIPFHFTSTDVQGGVAYYRVRQVFSDGSSRTSGTLKVGLGESLLVEEVLLVNFPNPFSTETTISYEVVERSPVSLTVWDVAGQSVAVLVDEVRPQGMHQAVFSAADLPSGIYFVRLEAGERVQSRKITVAR